MPGELAHVVKTTDGCCDKYEVVCKPETCAIQPPTCSPPQVMRNSNPGDCCPTFKCGKWLMAFKCLSFKDETQSNFDISQILVSQMPCTTNMSCESPNGNPIHCQFLMNFILYIWNPQNLNVFIWSYWVWDNSFSFTVFIFIFVLQVQLFWILDASTKSDYLGNLQMKYNEYIRMSWINCMYLGQTRTN